MKRQKHFFQFGIALSLATITISPILFLSSCATAPTWRLPINIGGVGDKSVWNGVTSLNTSTDFSDSYRIASLGDVGYPNYYSPDSKFNYLPSSYVSWTDTNGSNNYMYGTANDDSNYNVPYDNPKANTAQYYDPTYLSISDIEKKLKYSETFNIERPGKDDKSVSLITSMRNFNLLTALNLNSIASSISQYGLGLLEFMSQSGIIGNQNNTEWYDSILGSKRIAGDTAFNFNKGSESSSDEKNIDFYEFIYDFINVLSQGKSPVKFGESGVHYTFDDHSIYGPGPYVGIESQELSPTDPSRIFYYSTYKNFNGSWISNPLPAENNVLTSDATGFHLSSKFMVGLDSIDPTALKSPSSMGAYTSFSTIGKDSDNHANNKFYPNSIGGTIDKDKNAINISIPFLVKPGDLQFAYYNPLTKHSYHQDDYLLKDLTNVSKAIKSTNAWNSFGEHVGQDYQDKNHWAQSLSWDVNLNQGINVADTPAESAYGSTLSTAGVNDAFDDGDDPTTKALYLDPSIKALFDSDAIIVPNEYIAFGDYTFLATPKEGVNSMDGDNAVYDYYPQFVGIHTCSNGLPAVFPVSLLTNTDFSPNWEPTTFDKDILKPVLLPEANALYNYKIDPNDHDYALFGNDSDARETFRTNPYNNIWTWDVEKIAEKQTNVFKTLTKHIKPSDTTTSFFNNDDNKKAFYTIYQLFAPFALDVNKKWVASNNLDLFFNRNVTPSSVS